MQNFRATKKKDLPSVDFTDSAEINAKGRCTSDTRGITVLLQVYFFHVYFKLNNQR